MNDKQNKSNANQFSVQLANGKEATFASAAELTAWLEKQRGLESPRKRSTRAKASRTKSPNKKRTSKKSGSNKGPLARYANWHSGEA